MLTVEERPKTEQDGQNQSAASGGFETLIIDHLRVAGGYQKGESQVHPSGLMPAPLHAASEYKEKDGR